MRKNLRSARTIAGLSPEEFASMSARHQAILRRGIRGGSEDAPTLEEMLEAAAPDKAKELSDEDLGVLLDKIQAEAVALLEDPATATDDDIALAERCEAAIGQLETIQTSREAEATARTTKAQEILNKLKGETGDAGDGEGESDAGDGDGDGEGDAGDGDAGDGDAGDGEGDADAGDGDAGDGDAANAGDAEDTPEKIAAAAKAKKSVVTAMRPRSQRFAPRARAGAGSSRELVLRASSNAPGVSSGEILDTPEKRSEVICRAIKASAGHRGARFEMPLMTLGGAVDAEELYGTDRFLDDHERDNHRKIEKLTSYSALKASGGRCAPSPVQYDFPVVGTDARPVRDALARFGADRGGVRLIPPPVLSDVAAGTSTWTNANDISPSSPATKPCVTMTCPSDVETLVDAITQCIKIGNFRAKYFSEQVDAWIKEAGTWTARYAERKMLTTMGGLMKNVSSGADAATDLGTTRSVLRALDRASAGLRQQLRLPWDFPLRFISSGWLLDNMIADLAAEAPGASTERLATSDAEIEGFFRAKGINPSWSLDGESGQEFGAQADGALNGWPDHAIGYLFIEGQFLHLDGGEINLGIVRDSTLVGTNDAIMFSEFMENVAFHGNLAYRMDFNICADGRTSAPVAFAPCTTNS